MLHGMDAPGGRVAHLSEAVDRVGGGPHEAGSRVVIVGFSEGDRAVFDQDLQKCFAESLLHIGVFEAEIVFKCVAHDVGGAGGRLPFGNGKSIRGVENRHGGNQGRGAGSPFFMLRKVRNHGGRVHLRARGRQGDYGIDGEGSLYETPVQDQVPGVPVILRPGCHDLGAVNRAAAADGKGHVNPFCLAFLHALSHRLNPGIGLDPGQVVDRQPGLFQNIYSRIVYPVSFDAAAPVDEQNLRSALPQL